MQRASQVVSLTFFAVGILTIYESFRLTYWEPVGPGPGFFPRWIGIILAAMALLWLRQATAQKEEGSFVPHRGGLTRVGAILLGLVLYTAILGTAGYQLTTFAFLLFLLVALGRRHPALTLAIALLGSFGTYYVFTSYLKVPFPTSTIDLLANLGL